MKSNIFFVIFLSSIMGACNAQNRNYDNIANKLPSIYQNLDCDYLSITFYEKDTNSITVAYYEWEAYDNKVGGACMFIIPKKYDPNWYNRVIKQPKGKCNIEKKSIYFYTACELCSLVSQGIDELDKEFDIYIYIIPIEEMDGPFEEGTDGPGGVAYYYLPKKGSSMICYKYENSNWIEISRIKQKGDESARVYGFDFAKQMALDRVKEYLKSK